MTDSGGEDIRSTVEDSRSLLKKIELAVPGFAGYREKEDIRTADELLRTQMGKIVENALNNVITARQSLVNCFKLGPLNQIGTVVGNIETLRNLIIDAQQGYSGIAPDIRIGDSTLDKLYEYDYGFVSSVKNLERESSQMSGICDMNDKEITDMFSNINAAVNDAKNKWQLRMETVENIRVS